MDGEDLSITIVDTDRIVNKALDCLAQQTIAGLLFAGKTHEDGFVRVGEVEQIAGRIFTAEADIIERMRRCPHAYDP
jgi:hypothetical protein